MTGLDAPQPQGVERTLPASSPAIAGSAAAAGGTLTLVSVPMRSEPSNTIDAPGAPPAIGPYSHAVRAGDLLFCSGQIPLDPATGEIVGETPAEQAQRCLENLTAVCEAAGTPLAARCA